jgi:orotate phosphoribosyltransferase
MASALVWSVAPVLFKYEHSLRPPLACFSHARHPEMTPAEPLTDAELGAALREHAYLEGDFVLRSGRRSRYYLDKYRFETRPDLLGPLGERIARAVAEHEPEAVRLAGPELGAVPLAAAASLASGLPFLIVRKEAKEYGTGNQLEGVFEKGECVCLVEDVVTSGGAAVAAIEALREAGLTCRTAVCVVDREEGGVDALGRVAVRLRPLFRASELVGLAKPQQ